jgi:hypothetical protein
MIEGRGGGGEGEFLFCLMRMLSGNDDLRLHSFITLLTTPTVHAPSIVTPDTNAAKTPIPMANSTSFFIEKPHLFGM